MTKVILNKKTVLSLLKKKLNDKDLEEKITMLGTSLEYMNENELVVEVLPNRPDLLSEHGFARAFNSFLGYETGLKQYKIRNSNEKVIIENSARDARPFTACAIIKNLNLNNEKIKEIIQLQEKLHITYGRNRKKVAIGIYPFEKIKTPIRFLALEPGKIKFKPRGYDKIMNADEILTKHETGRKYSHLLKDLKKYPVFIDSNNNILSMPPIINSQDTGEVTVKTKEVFIECSGFDFHALNKCLNIIAASLADMGGKIYSMKLKYGNKIFATPDLKPSEMKIDLKKTDKLLGLNLKEKDIKKYLERMGFDYKNKKALIPAYRTDVIHEVDLIEDIAVAYGYDKFNAEIPNISTIGEEDDFESFKNKIADFLIGLNLLEVSSYNISNKHDQNGRMLVNNNLILLANSLTQDYNALRSWLIPSLLKILKENKHNEYPQRIFEIGRIFEKDKSETNVKEYDKLGIALSDIKTNFTEIKQILDALLNVLNIKYEINEEEHQSFIKGRAAKISINNKKIAYFGEISPAVLERWDLELPVAVLELDLNELFKLVK